MSENARRLKFSCTAVTIAALIYLCVLLFPMTANLPTATRDAKRRGEGLYQTSLTEAHFGLLGVHFYESNQGEKRWNIGSKFAELHRKQNYAFLETVDSEFYASRTGNIVYSQSKYGRIAMDKNRVDLEGEVSVRSKRGYLFEMDRLAYFGERHHFESVDPVTMRGPDVDRPSMRLQGVGMWADIDEEHFLLRNRVTAEKKLRGGDVLRIHSQSGEFFTHSQESIFRGNVRAILPKVVLTSDLLELEMMEDTESILASGRVRLSTKKRIGRAERARIEIASNHIVLEGRASVDSKGNRIEGHRITLNTDDDRIEVEQAQGSLEQ